MDDPVALPPLRRPNVLWIFGDQHRAQATGYRGDPNDTAKLAGGKNGGAARAAAHPEHAPPDRQGSGSIPLGAPNR